MRILLEIYRSLTHSVYFPVHCVGVTNLILPIIIDPPAVKINCRHRLPYTPLYLYNNCYSVSQKNDDTDVAYYNSRSTNYNYFWQRCCSQSLLSNDVFFIPPVLTSVSALPGETRTPEIVSFQSCCMPCIVNETARREIIFANCT